MKNIKIFYLLLFLLIFNACRDDDNLNVDCKPVGDEPCESYFNLTTVEDNCFELPPMPGIGWNVYTEPTRQHGTPAINPSNTEEFLYQEGVHVDNDGAADSVFLWKTNICTGRKNLIAENVAGSFPKWGKNDWIMFAGSKRIKSTGGAVEFFGADGVIYSDPTWLGNGDSLICKAVFSSPSETKTLILDFDGNTLHAFDYSTRKYSARNNKIATYRFIVDKPYLGYINLEDYSWHSFFEYPLEGTSIRLPHQIEWLDDDHILYSAATGNPATQIHKVNINTGVSTIIIEACETQYYPSFAVYPDDNTKLLAGRLDVDTVNAFTRTTDVYLVRIDLKTGEELKIELE